MKIEDGTGTGRLVGVTLDNQLFAKCTTASVEHYINHHYGEAYNVLFEQAPTAGDDCIIYIENGNDEDLVIEGVQLSVSGASEVYIQLNDLGTRNAATDLTPANLNTGTGNLADGEFEVGADLDGGAATLAGGVEIERYVFRAASDTNDFNFDQDVFITKNRTMTIWCDAIVTVNGTIMFHYANEAVEG